MSIGETFDDHCDEWKRWQGEPWGRLRYSIARANLLRHLPAGPLRILDAGGGNGLDSIEFAAEGHEVTLLDLSAEMLAEAGRMAAEIGATGRVILRQGDLATLPDLYPRPAFEVVLCHNVLQYVEDVSATLRAVVAPLREDGILSVMSANRYSEVYRAAIARGDLAAAHESVDNPRGEAFGVEVRRFSAEEVVEILADADCALIARYGVRAVSDYVADELKRDPESFARLELLELALAGRFPYYHTARFFQIVGRKAGVQ